MANQSTNRDPISSVDPLIDQERATRTTGPTHVDAPSAHELGREAAAAANEPHTHLGDAMPGSDDKTLHDKFENLTTDELSRLSILQPGTELEQGAVYVDLMDPTRSPFKALGGMTVEKGSRIIAKRETDYLLWNRLVRQDQGSETEPIIERPEREQHGIENQENLNQ